MAMPFCRKSSIASCCVLFFFSSRRRHTRFDCDWSSDVCSSDLQVLKAMQAGQSIQVIVVARGDLNVLQADLRRTGLKHTVRVPIAHGIAVELTRSGERRVGEEGRSRWVPDHLKKKKRRCNSVSV